LSFRTGGRGGETFPQICKEGRGGRKGVLAAHPTFAPAKGREKGSSVRKRKGFSVDD